MYLFLKNHFPINKRKYNSNSNIVFDYKLQHPFSLAMPYLCVKFTKNKMYPTELVMPMKAELTTHGFEDLTTPTAVDNAIKQPGTTLLVINSVCGCSAGTARPGVLMALQHAAKKPDHLATSFAGYDMDAVKQARSYLLPYPPSSPSVALLKDGQVVHMIERHMIEGRSAQMIAANLAQAFEQFCS
jgi:putative YphP/YqiW family bacilliredoxin